MEQVDINIILNELKEELKSKYPDFRGIYFFGSRARGDAHEDSDYDIVIVFDREIEWKFKREIRKYIYNKESLYNILFDPKIYRFNDILNPITYFRYMVKEEGLFYDAR
jgi:predicted nucleotidyltransferase